jgi:hypothetical protein
MRKYSSKRKTIRRKRRHNKVSKKRYGGTKYDKPIDLPQQMNYQDITDNAEYLKELSNPKDFKSYNVGFIYVIQYENTSQFYQKVIVKSVLPDELIVIPVLSKGAVYAKTGRTPYSVLLKNINYAYRVRYLGSLAFLNLSENIQNSEKSSKTPAYQKTLQDKNITDYIKSYL